MALRARALIRRTSLRKLGWALPLVALLPSACVATSKHPPSRAVVVARPPPPPLQETRPAPPSADATWLAGYWHWTGADYAWIPGHWENPPPGAAWYGPRYQKTQEGFVYEPGRWKPGAGRGGAPAERKAFR